MTEFGSTDDHQPVTWIGGHPIYAAHFIVLVFVASMFATTLCMFLRLDGVPEWLVFTGYQVLKGEVWRLFTYGLYNQPTPSFVIDMFLIAWIGRELERNFGRKTFFFLFGSLYLITPILLTALEPIWHSGRIIGETGAFALFIAFATLYPNVPVIFNVLAKWLAIVLVGIYSLMHLSTRSWVELLSLWATASYAFAFVRYHQGRIELPKFRSAEKKPQLRVVPDIPEAKRGAATPLRSSANDSMAEVDALLDKIAQSGISSLTPKERAKLDAAREALRKRGNH